MRKFVVSGFVLLVGIAAMAFASGSQQVQLNLTGWPYQVDTVNSNLKTFDSQNPGMTAQFTPLPSDSYADKMVASFAAGTQYDVVYVRDNFLGQWAAAKWITPIDNMPGVQQYIQDLPKSIVDQMSYDGHLYGLPYYVGLDVMAYNKKQLSDAGIQQPPATWKQLLADAKIIKDKGITQYPIILQLKKGNYVMQTLEDIVTGMGGTLFNNQYAAEFDKPNSTLVQAIDWLRQGLTQGLIDPASLSSDDHNVTQDLSAGTNTFTIVADYNVKTMNDPTQSKQAGNMANALIPGNGTVKSGTTSYVRLYSITAASKHKQDAWKLVQFLGGKDSSGKYLVATKWAVDFGLGFAYNSMYQDPQVVQSFGKWMNLGIEKEQWKYAAGRPYRFTPWFQTWQSSAWGTLQNMIQGTGSMSSELAQLKQQWTQDMSQYKK